MDTVSARAEPALLDAVGQLVLVLGVDGCKRLHYELCVATRSEATRRMLAAVRGLARLYGALNLQTSPSPPHAVRNQASRIPPQSEKNSSGRPAVLVHAIETWWSTPRATQHAKITFFGVHAACTAWSSSRRCIG